MSRSIWQVDPAHLTPYYDAALCCALAESGDDVCLFTSQSLYDHALPHPTNYACEQIYFRKLAYSRLLDYPRLRRILRAASYLLDQRAFLRRVRAHHPDLIHFQWLHLPQFDLWLIERIKQLGIPLVYTVHDVDDLFMYRQPRGYVQLYAEVDRIIVHAEANRQALIERYTSIPVDKIEVVPHIAVSFPVPAGSTRERARRLLDIPEKALVGLFMGTIRSYKGVDILVEACLSVQSVCPDLWIVVAGRCDDQQALGQLRRLRERFILHLAYIPTSDVWRYHLAADVAIFPYHRVSQSGALITAMGFGLPVIVSDVGGLPETVVGNGWIVPADDPEALAAALKMACHAPDELRRMGKRSRTLIQERHNAADVSVRLNLVYEEVCSCGASFSAPTV